MKLLPSYSAVGSLIPEMRNVDDPSEELPEPMKFDFPKHRVLRTPATLHPTEYTKGWNLRMYWYKT